MTDGPPAGLPPLAPDAVLVHIGPHKTGTTAIQTTLAGSRPLLREAGVSYPGKTVAHHKEAMALRQYRQGWASDSEPPPPLARWERLATRATQAPGRVVISSELFSEADGPARAMLVDQLGPSRVHIVVGARNAADLAVSTWQQVLRTYGRPDSLEEWLEKNFRREVGARGATQFWGRADTSELIDRWLDVVPPERFTVLVVDDQDRNLMPASFEQLLALPPGTLVDQPVPFANRGLTSAEVALVRQILETIDSQLTWDEYTRTMRRGVLQRLVGLRRPGPDEGKPQLPQWAHDQSVAEGDLIVEQLQAAGVRVVGNLDALRTKPSGEWQEDAPITHVPLEMAAEAVVGAIAIATRDTWRLDAPAAGPTPAQPTEQTTPSQPAARSRPKSPEVDTLSTQDLSRLVLRRVRAGIGRRTGDLVRKPGTQPDGPPGRGKKQ